MQRIDFSSSWLTWLTKKEKSYGRFQLDAACTIRDISRNKVSKYYLSNAVIAGNVYAKNNLVKKPVYLFQIAASNELHVIFRTFVSHANEQSHLYENTALFEEVKFRIVKKEAIQLRDFDEINFYFQHHKSISALISYSLGQDCRIEIEFPIKHINIQKERRLFQVETGPVLIPVKLPADSPSTLEEYTFDTAFVHFNHLDGAEFTKSVPTPVGQETMSFFSQVVKMKLRIMMMTDKDKKGST